MNEIIAVLSFFRNLMNPHISAAEAVHSIRIWKGVFYCSFQKVISISKKVTIPLNDEQK